MNASHKLEQYTPQEVNRILDHLSGIFTGARLVDPDKCMEIAISPDGGITEICPCYDRWMLCERCENCISQDAVRDKCKYEKFEMLGDTVCWVLAKPITVILGNGKRHDCAIEVLKQSSVEEYGSMLSSNLEVSTSLLDHKGFYTDWATKVYNRRYFDEGVYLAYLNLKPSIDLGLVVCKLENMEYLVDMFGSEQREAAAKQLVKLIERQRRPRDLVIRVDDDKILIIMPQATSEDVRAVADKIRLDAPSILSGDAWSAADVFVSVGFAWASQFDRTSAHVNALFREAEENAYLDRRGIRKSWDDMEGNWKFSVSDAVKAAAGNNDASDLERSERAYEGSARMENATTMAEILESAPATSDDSLSVWFREFAKKDRTKPSDAYRFPLPLMERPFVPGTMKIDAESFDDKTTRALARIEVQYLTGDYLQARRDAEALMEGRNDLSVRVAAGLLDALANLATNHPVFARQAKDNTATLCQKGILGSSDSKTRAVCAIVDSTIVAFFDEERRSATPIAKELTELPEGQRLFASFLIALQKFSEGEYGNSLGVVNTALSYCADVYPVPMIYLHIVAASDHMALRELDEAKREFEQAWELARHDGIISPFVEHYVKLQGLLDACMKKENPEMFRTISKAAQLFRAGWVSLADPSMPAEHIGMLSASEMTIAALASRGWTNREIAMHMKLSENTVKHRASFIYQKLHINRRADLSRFKLT